MADDKLVFAFSFSLPRFTCEIQMQAQMQVQKVIFFHFLRLNLLEGSSHVSVFPFVFICIDVARTWMWIGGTSVSPIYTKLSYFSDF